MKSSLWYLTAALLSMLISASSRADDIDDLLSTDEPATEQSKSSKPQKPVMELPDVEAPVVQAKADEEVDQWADIVTGKSSGSSKSTKKSAKAAKKQVEAPAPVLPNLEKLDDQTHSLSIDGEAAEADIIAYEDITIKTSREAAILKDEINYLEKKVSNAKNGAERAKQKALLVQKRLELQKQNKKDAEKNLAKIEQLRKQQDRQLSKLKERTEAVEERLALAKKRTQSSQSSLKDMQRASSELERKLKRLQAQIDREQQRQKALLAKRSAAREKNQRLKSQVKAAEKRMARY